MFDFKGVHFRRFPCGFFDFYFEKGLLSAIDALVWTEIAHSEQFQTVFSISGSQRSLGISPQTVRRSLANLEKLKMVRKIDDKQGKASSYGTIEYKNWERFGEAPSSPNGSSDPYQFDQPTPQTPTNLEQDPYQFDQGKAQTPTNLEGVSVSSIREYNSPIVLISDHRASIASNQAEKKFFFEGRLGHKCRTPESALRNLFRPSDEDRPLFDELVRLADGWPKDKFLEKAYEWKRTSPTLQSVVHSLTAHTRKAFTANDELDRGSLIRPLFDKSLDDNGLKQFRPIAIDLYPQNDQSYGKINAMICSYNLYEDDVFEAEYNFLKSIYRRLGPINKASYLKAHFSKDEPCFASLHSQWDLYSDPAFDQAFVHMPFPESWTLNLETRNKPEKKDLPRAL